MLFMVIGFEGTAGDTVLCGTIMACGGGEIPLGLGNWAVFLRSCAKLLCLVYYTIRYNNGSL